MEEKFTGDDVYWGTSLSVLEMLKGGTTTFLDMYDHMDRVAEVAELSGIRSVLMRGVIGLCPEDVQNHKLAEAISFARNWHGKADGRITTMISPHAPYTCPPDLWLSSCRQRMIWIYRCIRICPKRNVKWNKMWRITGCVL